MFRLQVDDATELLSLELRHAPKVFRLVDENRSMLRRWLPWVDATKTVDDTVDFIESSLKKLSRSEELVTGIWHEGEFAGTIGTIFAPGKPTAELGYWIGSAFQGKGLVTNSIRALLPYLFSERDVESLVIHCVSENEKSRAVALRLGFESVGFEDAGDKEGELRFVLQRRDWRKSQRAAVSERS